MGLGGLNDLKGVQSLTMVINGLTTPVFRISGDLRVVRNL